MGGWASFWIFSVGRVGGSRVFVVKNRVGVGGCPGTHGPVGKENVRLRSTDLEDLNLQVLGHI